MHPTQHLPFPPLPRRVVARPWEDLTSVVRRAAQKMGYADLRWVLRPEKAAYPIEAASLPVLSDETDYAILSHLLQLGETTIYRHTIHSLACPEAWDETIGTASQPEQYKVVQRTQIEAVTLKRFFVELSSIKVCPYCLQEEEGYDRLYWRMRFLFLCPRHRIPLRDQCPACGAAIPAFRAQLTSCPACGKGDYRTPTKPPYPESHPHFLGILLLLHAWGIEEPEWRMAAPGLATSQLLHISRESSRQLFQEIFFALHQTFSPTELAIFNLLLGTTGKEDALSRVQPIQGEHEAFTLFHGLFLHWPTKFSAFLDFWYRLAQPPMTEGKTEAILRQSQQLWYDPWQSPTWDWLRDAFTRHGTLFLADETLVGCTRDRANALAQELDARRGETGASGTPDQRHAWVPCLHSLSLTPYPWESLSSLLCRAARRHHIPHPEDLLHPAFTSQHLTESFLELPLSQGHLALLASLFQLDEETISRLSLHRFASIADPPKAIPLLWHNLVPCLSFFAYRYMNNTALCPLCLAEDAESYDRVYWKICGVLTCPQHHIRLVSRCPACARPIPSLRAQAHLCPFCHQGDYRTATSAPLATGNILEAGTTLLLEKLRILPVRKHTNSEILPTVWKLPPPFYFALFEELALELLNSCEIDLLELLRALYPSFEEEVRPDLKEWEHDDALFVVLFHTLFTQWPTRFWAFLDVLYSTAPRPYGSSFTLPMDRYRKIFEKRLGREAHFPWLWAAFEEHWDRFSRSDWYRKAVEEEASLVRQAGKVIVERLATYRRTPSQ